MKDKLLRAQAWKYFIPVFIIPQVASHFLLNSYFSSITDVSDFNPDSLMLRLSVVIFIGLICSIPFYLWMYAVGNELPKYIPEKLRVLPGFFNIALVSSFFLSGISSLLFLVGAKNVMHRVMDFIDSELTPDDIDPSEFIGMLSEFKLAGILMLVGLTLTLYCYYFSAKTISKAKLQDTPRFSDNLVNFILHFVFFGSIWYFQPEIKKVMDRHRGDGLDTGITDIDDILDDRM